MSRGYLSPNLFKCSLLTLFWQGWTMAGVSRVSIPRPTRLYWTNGDQVSDKVMIGLLIAPKINYGTIHLFVFAFVSWHKTSANTQQKLRILSSHTWISIVLVLLNRIYCSAEIELFLQLTLFAVSFYGDLRGLYSFTDEGFCSPTTVVVYGDTLTSFVFWILFFWFVGEILRIVIMEVFWPLIKKARKKRKFEDEIDLEAKC